MSQYGNYPAPGTETYKKWQDRLDKIKEKKKEVRNNSIKITFLIAFLWVSMTVVVQRFKCAELTETELFIRIPNCIVLDFKNCNS